MTNTSLDPRKIVVGYDGSDLSDLALSWAIDTGRARSAPVEVLVATALPATVATWAPYDESYLEGMREIAAQAEKHVAESGYADATVRTVEADAVTALTDAGREAAMLVVGARGHGLLATTFTGSVSKHLATYATCPVVVVRPTASESESARRIVVGIDGGPSSAPALRFACRHAELTGLPVTAVMAYPSTVSAAGSIGAPDLHVDASDAERALAEALAGITEDYPGVEVTRETVPMRPERVLSDASEAAALVVVGARGRNPFARMLLGSVSQHVLQHAHCPVAVVR